MVAHIIARYERQCSKQNIKDHCEFKAIQGDTVRNYLKTN